MTTTTSTKIDRRANGKARRFTISGDPTARPGQQIDECIDVLDFLGMALGEGMNLEGWQPGRPSRAASGVAWILNRVRETLKDANDQLFPPRGQEHADAPSE
jgi:hypothetical protein